MTKFNTILLSLLIVTAIYALHEHKQKISIMESAYVYMLAYHIDELLIRDIKGDYGELLEHVQDESKNHQLYIEYFKKEDNISKVRTKANFVSEVSKPVTKEDYNNALRLASEHFYLH